MLSNTIKMSYRCFSAHLCLKLTAYFRCIFPLRVRGLIWHSVVLINTTLTSYIVKYIWKNTGSMAAVAFQLDVTLFCQTEGETRQKLSNSVLEKACVNPAKENNIKGQWGQPTQPSSGQIKTKSYHCLWLDVHMFQDRHTEGHRSRKRYFEQYD